MSLVSFLYEIFDDEHDIGSMEDWNINDSAEKEFDVVQELLSQVVQRKSSN